MRPDRNSAAYVEMMDAMRSKAVIFKNYDDGKYEGEVTGPDLIDQGLARRVNDPEAFIHGMAVAFDLTRSHALAAMYCAGYQSTQLVRMTSDMKHDLVTDHFPEKWEL